MIDRKITVLIVDDSAFMRKSLSIILSSDPQIEIVGTARNGAEGVNLAQTLKPDIITLDIEMPVMDGLTALKKIMKDCPTSVIMVSSLTTEGAESTLKALELGAVDFIPKEMSFVSVNIVKIKEDLIQKVKAIARRSSLRRLQRFRTTFAGEMPPPVPISASQSIQAVGNYTRNYKAIALGISTGGPLSLQKVIPLISEKLNCPMFIVQHMPPKFTKSLADRLNSLSKISVKEAEDSEVIKNGTVYIAPGGFHMTINTDHPGINKISINTEPSTTLHRPSVDVMLKSVVKAYSKSTLGIIMTGMGKDGLEGIKELKSIGGIAIAQDEESCVVYGMPRAVVEDGSADLIIALDKMSEVINKLVIR